MSSFYSRHSVRRPIAAAGLALAFTAVSVAVALAGDVGQAGPMINVTADGGDVKVAGASVTVVGTATDVRAAGALLDVRVTATGNVYAAGAQISVGGSVGGDLKVIGAVLDIRGRIGGNADLAGAVVKSDIQAGGRVRAGGANVTFGLGTDIRGSLETGGGIVTVAGHIGGTVQIVGAVINFDGQADGPVEISGDRVTVGPNAKIGGDLTVRSRHAPEIAASAVVSGTVNKIEPPTWCSVAPWMWAVGIAAAIAVGTILAGVVLMLFGGRVFATATEHVRHRPLSSFLFGILAWVLIPFIAAVLIATIVGITIGFAILLILPLLVIFGHAVAAAGIASGLLIRRHGELGVVLGLVMLVLGAIILVAIGLIPWVGPALVGIAIVLGTGAFTRTLGSRIRRAEPRLPI